MIAPIGFYAHDDEPLSRAVRRIVGEQIALALGAVRANPDDPELLEAGVHEARRTFKKIRAALRLVRHGMAAGTFQRENRFFRDAGRALSPLRDADVLVATAGPLGRLPGEEGPVPVRVLRRRLLERRTRLRAGLPADGAPVRLAPSLEAAARRAARWRISGPEEDVALGGLHTAYERGRAAMVEAYHSGAHGHRFHDWRKRAKDLRYQLELLRGLWPQVQAAVASEMHRLTDFLGTANDFQVMATTLRREPDLVRGLRDPLALERRARFHRDRLAAEARPLGERLYAEAPETFRERHQALWSAWRR